MEGKNIKHTLECRKAEYSKPSDNKTELKHKYEISPFKGEEEFCYDEDEFHEENPFGNARMTASYEGSFAIIGSNNGYHFHNNHPTNQVEPEKFRAIAKSMPQIPSQSSCDKFGYSEKELNCREEDAEEHTFNKNQQMGDTIKFQENRIFPLKQCDSMSSKNEDNFKNDLEKECEEDESLDLEFEYEPGISLSHMEFGRHTDHFQINQEEIKNDKLSGLSVCRRKMSEMCTSSSCSSSQVDRYHNMMTTKTRNSNTVLGSTSDTHGESMSTIGCNLSFKSPLVSQTRCTYCGVDYESGK